MYGAIVLGLPGGGDAVAVVGELRQCTRPMLDAELIRRRGNRLARGLLRLRGGGISSIAIYVADPNSVDARVAVDAAQKLQVAHTLLTVPDDPSDAEGMVVMIDTMAPTFVLACERGVEALRGARICARVIGDGEGVRWWRALEARESADDLWECGARHGLVGRSQHR